MPKSEEIKQRKGFTLMVLSVMVSITAITAGVILVHVQGSQRRAAEHTAASIQAEFCAKSTRSWAQSLITDNPQGLLADVYELSLDTPEGSCMGVVKFVLPAGYPLSSDSLFEPIGINIAVEYDSDQGPIELGNSVWFARDINAGLRYAVFAEKTIKLSGDTLLGGILRGEEHFAGELPAQAGLENFLQRRVDASVFDHSRHARSYARADYPPNGWSFIVEPDGMTYKDDAFEYPEIPLLVATIVEWSSPASIHTIAATEGWDQPTGEGESEGSGGTTGACCFSNGCCWEGFDENECTGTRSFHPDQACSAVYCGYCSKQAG